MTKGRAVLLALLMGGGAVADVPLMGSNLPGKSLLDGDFEEVRAGWRNPGQSPYWTTKVVEGNGKVGFALGRMMNGGAAKATVESRVLDHTGIKALKVGDVLAWRFASNTEYPCDGRVSLALVFGDSERMVAGRVKVPNGPAKPQVYEGFYTVTARDAKRGMPKLKFTLESTHGIIVYVYWVDVKVLQGGVCGLAANAIDAGIELSWNSDENKTVTVYRSDEERTGYGKMADGIDGNHWIDRSIIHGKTYCYAVKQGTSVSPVVKARKMDSVPPAAPHAVEASGEDWVVKLGWKTGDNDVEYFKVYRDGICIAPHVAGNHFEDMLPPKGVRNSYAVMAVDYSGNASPLSEVAMAKVKAVRGASFSDLILPMPIHQKLRSDLWGAASVRPRDPDNGVEHPDWSYWGGKPIKDPSDGKYHICVTRWPEGDRKGHWPGPVRRLRMWCPTIRPGPMSSGTPRPTVSPTGWAIIRTSFC